jgi:hypothetical protein
MDELEFEIQSEKQEKLVKLTSLRSARHSEMTHKLNLQNATLNNFSLLDRRQCARATLALDSSLSA